MPEGPEIKRVADRLSKALVGNSIDIIRFLYPSISKAEQTVHGSKVSSVNSIGKALLINFDNGHSLYSHNQLYGKWSINLKSTDPKTNRSLRVEFVTDKRVVIVLQETEIFR